MKNKSKVIARVLAIMLMLAAAFTVTLGTVNAKAAPDVGDIMSGDNHMFDQTTDVVKGAGGSAKNLITTIAVIVLVIGLIIVGLQFTTKNSAKRQEAKANLVAIIVGAVIVFAAVAIITLSGTIADALEGSVNAPTPTPGTVFFFNLFR